MSSRKKSAGVSPVLRAFKTKEDRKKFADILWADYQLLGSSYRVGEKHGINHASVHRYLKVYGGYRLKGDKFTEADDDLIRSYYATTSEQDFDLDELVKKLKRPEKTNVCRRARQLGLTQQSRPQNKTTRSKMSDRAKAWHATHEHPRGYLGHVHGEETRRKLSIKSQQARANITEEQEQDRVIKMLKTKHKNGTLYNPRFKALWKAQWAEIGGRKNYYRSRWELNYALYLQWLKENNQIKEWEHEPETFWFMDIMRGTRSYLPDFRVTEINGDIAYHEIKGWMDDRSKTKIKRMAKYYPEVKLIVIDAKDYRNLERKVKHLVKGWQ